MGIGEQFAEKWVELLKEAAPQMSRLAVLWDPTRPAMRAILTATERAARAFGLRVHLLEARDASEVAQALVAITRENAEALVILPSILFGREHRPGSAFMANSRLPAIYWDRGFAEAGGQMSYGPDVRALMRRAAYYVDRILKGAKPADLPVEQPIKFELASTSRRRRRSGSRSPQRSSSWRMRCSNRRAPGHGSGPERGPTVRSATGHPEPNQGMQTTGVTLALQPRA